MTRARGLNRQMPRRVFRDRREAGRVLAELLSAYQGRTDVVVLGLARGGLPVAWEVAAGLGAPLDAFIVRKLGAPEHEEFAVGALASGGRVVVNDDVLRALRVTPQQLQVLAARYLQPNRAVPLLIMPEDAGSAGGSAHDPGTAAASR